MGIVDIAGVAGLAIALGSVAWQAKDYSSRLRMSVLDLVIPHVYKNISLVLVRLAFVNPSSQVRSVCHVDISIKSIVNPVLRAEVLATYSEDFRVLFYKPSIEETNYQFPVPTSESLQIPLDIPPHQSVSKWCVFALGIEGDYSEPRIAIAEFRVYDKLKISGFGLSLPKRPMAYCWKQVLAGKTITASWPFY
jgi:hypothetical protein